MMKEQSDGKYIQIIRKESEEPDSSMAQNCLEYVLSILTCGSRNLRYRMPQPPYGRPGNKDQLSIPDTPAEVKL